MNITVKQISILRVIAAGNEDGSLTDLDQLLDRISYETTKASIQFSIRSLIKNGLIEKQFDRRRGRMHVSYRPTELCRRVLGKVNGRSPGVVIEVQDDIFTEELEALAL